MTSSNVAVAGTPVAAPAGPPAGPSVSGDRMVFRVADPEGRYGRVRLAQEVRIPGDRLGFTRTATGWELELPRPPVLRMEYRLSLDGEEVCDPANPLRSPGAFGEKSVLEFPGYVRPAWLDADAPAGSSTELHAPSRYLGESVYVRIWSPAGVTAGDPLPLLIAHDGPEYDQLSSLTAYSAAMIEAGALPAHRVALLGPGHRDEWYSASVAYARALNLAVLPAVRREVAVDGPVAAMGASLGGLAALHASRRHPGTIGGLFLQSSSFFSRRLDAVERAFPRYARITRYVADTRRGVTKGDPLPVTLTCGGIEENLANNRQMAEILRAQGYPVELVELADVHNYTAWRDAFDPHLTDLLRRTWTG
jgi:enterochelin esterase family protein